MQPLQITFRNVPPLKTIERMVRQKARKLQESHNRLVKCHVTLETKHQPYHKGDLYDVHIDLEMPGRNFTITSTEHDNSAHGLLSRAIRDAFDMAEQQLQDHHTRARRNPLRTSYRRHP